MVEDGGHKGNVQQGEARDLGRVDCERPRLAAAAGGGVALGVVVAAVVDLNVLWLVLAVHEALGEDVAEGRNEPR